MTFVLMFQHVPAGHLHHRVHVFRKSEAVFEKDKEKSQDYERKGVATAADHNLTERVMLTRKFSADLFSSLTCFCIRQAWKRWCTQILSALRWAQRLWRQVSPLLLRFLSRSWFLRSYLHSCEPAIIHGNLTCDTIFIQHNGLIKIGSGRSDGLENDINGGWLVPACLRWFYWGRSPPFSSCSRHHQ